MRAKRTPFEPDWLDHPSRVTAFRAALLGFFAREQRALPWRETRNPYAILVSEIMLQQTRVDTVLPYYRRWMRQFPDLTALAFASEDEVLRAWQGLGYYRRARNLHRLAQQLVAEDRPLPATATDLRSLPGIGAYTAGAVASIAFGEAVPAVDGNVRRVFARLFDDPAPSPTWLARVASVLVSPDAPGDFNQALMELGALCCTPRDPRCEACPVLFACASRRAGTQMERPAPPRRRAIPHVHEVAVLLMVRERGTGETRVLLERRPDKGLLAGMWTLPLREIDPVHRGDPVSAAIALARDLLGVPIVGGEARPHHVHLFTHRKVTYHPVQFVLRSSDVPPAPPPGRRWVDQAGLDALPLPRAQQHLLEGADWLPMP